MIKLEGQQIGGYEVLEPLAELDLCRVYKARCVDADRPHVSVGDEVALKVYNPVREDSESCERFDRLAGILLDASHPNIVRYVDAFKWKNGGRDRERLPCLVMDALEGESLADRLRRNQEGLTRKEQFELLKQTLDALVYAAEKDILPRHFDPSKVLFCKDGTFKVFGFGMPRQGKNGGATVSGSVDFFHYIAPDFVRADACGDEASLVFSLGVCFYEAIAGHLP